MSLSRAPGLSRWFPVFLALFALSTGASAATIIWGSAFDAGSVSDVDVTGGTVVYAMNGGSNTPTISGINFTSTDYGNLPTNVSFIDNLGSTTPGSRATSGVITGSTGDTFYDSLLNEAVDTEFGITDGTMTFGGLTDGVDYQIQVWYSDTRGLSSIGNRTMTYGDGNGNTVGLANVDNFGQTAVGTFTAVGTSQDLTHVASGFGNVHYNGILLQTVPVPEPSSAALLLGLVVTASACRRCRS